MATQNFLKVFLIPGHGFSIVSHGKSWKSHGILHLLRCMNPGNSTCSLMKSGIYI